MLSKLQKSDRNEDFLLSGMAIWVKQTNKEVFSSRITQKKILRPLNGSRT